MKRYDSYKPSGISWIGEIPSHWEEKRISSLFHDKVSSNSEYSIKNAHKFNYGKLVPKNESGDISEYKETYLGYSLLQTGDIVINGLNLNYDFVSQRVAIAEEDCIITSAYLPLRPYKATNSMYFTWLFKAMDSRKLFHGMGTGIRLTLSFNEFKAQQIPVPPLAEQEKIVDYLTTKTSQIDAQVADREREIQLLNELKQAEIANVVTRGLNPDVPMKDAQTLLGSHIPKEWKLIRMRNLVSEQNELVGDRLSFPLLSLTKGGIILRDVESGKGKFPKDFQKYKVVTPGNIIFCLFDIDETPRTVGLSALNGMITGAYDVFSINTNLIDPTYLYLYFLAVDNIKALRPHYTGLRKVVQMPVFLGLQIPIPPIEEQRAIVEYIQKKNSAIDDMITNLKAEIEFLSEYKQRLIADAVTGQIKVD